MPPIEKSRGLTDSERLVAHLCEKTFLSLWSYPNLFRAAGQELCDVLVIFGNHVIIFSDKSCQFPATGNLEIDWKRWHKRAVRHSARQVLGAERWIREHPDRIFLDAAATRRLPLSLPPAERLRIHNVAVAQNAAARCREYCARDGQDGGSGSLFLMPNLGEEADAQRPFAVGTMAPPGKLVHVLDEVTLPILLRELNTVADFVAYLERKEELIRSGRLALSTGEEELLAYYFTSGGAIGRGFHLPDDGAALAISDGHWALITEHPLYAEWKRIERESYLWDALIETFSSQYLSGKLVVGNEEDASDFSRGVAVMASESRSARRRLSRDFKEHLENARKRADITRVAWSRFLKFSATGYVFEVTDHASNARLSEIEDAEFRLRLRSMLLAACMKKKVEYPELNILLGIGCESRFQRGRPIELLYMDASTMDRAMMEQAEHFLRMAEMAPKMGKG